jgi:hypothetical protein
MLGLPVASSQTISTTTSSGVHIVAGVAVVKPRIDGVWQKGEWDDANEYRFSTVTYEVNGMSEAYVRCKHDNASLYCLIDVPSDSGATYTRGGQNYTGDAAFSFDRDMDGLNQIDPADLGFDITAIGNKTLLSFIFNEPAWSSQVNVTQQLGGSPHSNNSHKVYEISMPLGPLLQYNKNAQSDNLPAVNLDLTVTDSYGNRMDLSGPPYLSVLEIGVMPVPEGIDPLLPLAPVMLILIIWVHRKDVRDGSAE